MARAVTQHQQFFPCLNLASWLFSFQNGLYLYFLFPSRQISTIIFEFFSDLSIGFYIM
jgi:hypothetical protein